MRHWLSAVVLFLLLCATHGGAEAATVTYQQEVSGYAGCTDTTIITDGFTYDTNTNFGLATEVLIGCEQWNPG